MDRFWSKVEKTDTCWLWMAYISGGYGRFKIDGRHHQAHRVAYELLVGPIPEGLELDHVRERGCYSRHCVNPAHLEPVTHAENVRRGDLNKRQKSKTRCPQGHTYDEGNTYIHRGKRSCRTCMRTRSRDRKRRAAQLKEAA